MRRHFLLRLLTIALSTPSFVSAAVQNFANDTVGAEPKSFAAVVGNWIVIDDSGKRRLSVNGSKWSSGQASAGLADKARSLYGERYAEFLDSVKAYAYYPVAIFSGVADFKEGTITVRFKGISGRIDQAAGIAFNVKPNGDYLSLRANCLEDNLVLWQVQKGRRSSVKWVRNTPTPSGQWHELKLHVAGNKVTGWLDGRQYLEHSLSEPISGRIGLWSKADSVVYFDDFSVEAGKP